MTQASRELDEFGCKGRQAVAALEGLQFIKAAR
jgi:hypothetical protein